MHFSARASSTFHLFLRLALVDLQSYLFTQQRYSQLSLRHAKADTIGIRQRKDPSTGGIQSTLVIADTFRTSFCVRNSESRSYRESFSVKTSIDGYLNFVRNSEVSARRELTVLYN